MIKLLNGYKTCWNIWSCFPSIILCVIVIDAIFITTVLSRQTNYKNEKQGANFYGKDTKSQTVKYTESEERDVFQALSKTELKAVRSYIFNDAFVNSNTTNNEPLLTLSIFYLELLMPPKSEVLSYLDNGGQQPARWAKAVLLRGDARPPVVEEYKIGPLPTPTSHELIASVDFDYRPCTAYDDPSIVLFLKEINQNISDLLVESYGATFFDCGQNCFSYIPVVVIPHLHNSNKRTYTLITWRPYGEEASQTINLGIIFDQAAINGEIKTELLEIWYGSQIFNTTEELMDNYRNDKPGFTKFVFPKPTPEEPNVLRMKMRNKQNGYLPIDLTKSTEYLRPPVTHEPDGKRYKVHDHTVSYLEWQFSYQLRTSKGPSIFDVRFQGERIAYEISLQDVSAIYSSHRAPWKHIRVMDSCFLLGLGVGNLVPGFDCPDHASFLPIIVSNGNSDEPTHYPRAFCLFEINHPVPLHRHRDFSFYGGLPNYALTLRTMITVVNYDYMLDFNFFQTGGVEVKIHSTGYPNYGYYDEMERGYGWELPNNVITPIHHHIFNYKVDVDIHGTSNRFEKLEIKTRTVPNTGSPIFKPNISLMYFERILANTEDDGKYDFDFEKPTYLIFHNNERKQEPDMPKSYRLHAGGISPLLIPEEETLKSFSFARHQVVVTQRKESETESTSVYQMAEGADQRVCFSDFSNSETIVDQDLVAWVNLGFHHIPHTEDFPTTPTTGTGFAFHLTPYNYFPLCPSYQSLDGVYFKQNVGQPNLPPISVQNVLINFKNGCPSQTLTFLRKLKLNPNLFF